MSRISTIIINSIYWPLVPQAKATNNEMNEKYSLIYFFRYEL